MQISRNDILTIAKNPYNNLENKTIDEVDYNKWIEFIENNKQHFVWFENTEEGKLAIKNIDQFPEWAKERVMYTLNKKRVYVTDVISKNPSDIVFLYSESDKRVNIHVEKKLNSKIFNIIQSMANYLECFILKNGEVILDDYIN